MKKFILKNISKIGIWMLFAFSLSTSMAQVALPASGGIGTGTDGKISITVGQVFYKTNANPSGSVAEGVQQPYEISIVTEIPNAKGILLSVTTYPNPTSDYFTININDYEIKNLSYQLYNINGKLIASNKIESNETQITMNTYENAIYLIKILDNNQEIKTFKVIKN